MARLRRLLLGVVAVLVVGAGAQLWHVHETTWDYRLWSAAAPAKVHFDGRDYHRDVVEVPVPSDAERIGYTSGGGQIWSAARAAPGIVRTSIWVVHGGRATAYGLMGGP